MLSLSKSQVSNLMSYMAHARTALFEAAADVTFI
jgi:hypothetical protein